jgi:hypothetical protein
MERLTAEDRLMLWPDERWPQEIGALAVLDGARLLDRSLPNRNADRPDRHSDRWLYRLSVSAR